MCVSIIVRSVVSNHHLIVPTETNLLPIGATTPHSALVLLLTHSCTFGKIYILVVLGLLLASPAPAEIYQVTWHEVCGVGLLCD